MTPRPAFLLELVVVSAIAGGVWADVASAQPAAVPASATGQMARASVTQVGTPTRPPAAVSRAGRLEGTVTDEGGAPLQGVAVSVLGDDLRFAMTDRAGRFQFDLPAGSYSIRAHLPGFVASRREQVRVSPATATTTKLSLVRSTASTPSERRVIEAGVGIASSEEAPAPAGTTASDTTDHDHSPLAWRVRHLKRSVLRETEQGIFTERTVDFGEQLLGSGHALALATGMPFSGQVNLITISSFDSPQELFTGTRVPNGVAYIAITAPAGGDAIWSVQGALTQGDVASWVLGGRYSTTLTSRHATTVGITYAAQRYEGGNPLALAAMSETSRTVGTIQGTDEWRLADTMSLAFGAAYAKHGYLEGGGLFSPSVQWRWAPDKTYAIRAMASQLMLAPGAEEFVPSPVAGMWMPPQRTFAPLISSEGFRAERTRHVELAYERQFGSLVFTARGFRQSTDDQLVAVFGFVPVDVPRSDLGHYFTASAGDVTAFGWGVAVSRPVGSRVRGSVAYTLAHASRLGLPEGAYSLAAVRAVADSPGERIHDITTCVETEIPETATRVYAMYKINSAYARDETFERTPGMSVRFDVQVNQRLPSFLPLGDTEWEALVAVRNLFRDPQDGSSIYDELLVVRPPKRIVGGLLLRF